MLNRLWFIALFLLTSAAVVGANSYYTHGGFPATGSVASSAGMRAELDLITAGFDKLPTFTGNASKAVVINGGETAMSVTTGTLTLAGNFAISGAYATTLTVTGATNVTLPTTGTLATLAGAESLTNKTLTAPVLSGSVTGTYTLAGTPTITAPAISSPVFSGTATGTYTLAGTPTITAPIFSGSATGTYTLAGTPTISAHTVSGTLTPTKACSSGFSRLTPNYCRNSTAGGPGAVALTNNGACNAATPAEAVPTGSIADIEIVFQILSQNSTGLRGVTVTTYTTNVCTGGTEDRLLDVSAREQVAVSSQFLVSTSGYAQVKFYNTDLYYKTVNAATGSTLLLRVLGYYD